MSKLPATDGQTQVAPGSFKNLLVLGKKSKSQKEKGASVIYGFGVDMCSDQSWPQCDANNFVHNSSFTR